MDSKGEGLSQTKWRASRRIDPKQLWAARRSGSLTSLVRLPHGVRQLALARSLTPRSTVTVQRLRLWRPAGLFPGMSSEAPRHRTLPSMRAI
jgi:hypothetical protein